PPVAPVRTPDQTVRLVGGPIPFPFEANVGQADDGVAFLLRDGDLMAGFGAGGVTYQLLGRDPSEAPSNDPAACDSEPTPKRPARPPDLVGAEGCRPLRAYRVSLEL